MRLLERGGLQLSERERFEALAARALSALRPGEVLLLGYSGERSDFVRFNHARVRQAGSVEQRSLSVRLVHERRQAQASVVVSEDLEIPVLVKRLRDVLQGVPEDPWLLFSENPHSTVTERRAVLPSAEEVAEHIVRAAHGLDLVGIYAAGTIYRGFANSLGQRNWHEVDSFNFDWSIYRRADQAVKSAYAGFEWEPGLLEEKMRAAEREAALLDLPLREIPTGEVRAYLAPRALEEIVGMLSWGGFSARARETKQSPLLRMQGGAALSPKVTLAENTAAGVAPGFQAEGFVKPGSVTLLEGGKLGEPLISPRSAKEYGLASNAANGAEAPESLDMRAGDLSRDEALVALERGLYIGNLWYLNYSDRPAGRLTGMTRFATFLVEDGRIAAPVAPMRFDDSLYRILGECLVDLTRERELLLDASTYEERSTSSARLPGALLSALRFTL